MKPTFILLCLSLSTHVVGTVNAWSNSKSPKITYQADSLPTIFMIGQFTDLFEKLNSNHQTLLEVCHNDVYLAYDKWLHMLGELEANADAAGLSLKGSKYWFSVFWNEDGSIRHLAYFPKSGSKPIEQKILTQVLASFIADYKMPVASKGAYYNYGSAAFPLPDRRPTAKRF